MTDRLARMDKPEPKSKRDYRIRKARLAAAREKGTHSAEQWVSLIAEFGGRCVMCGTAERKIVKDHITPIYQGGSDGVDNLQPLCIVCNSAKGPDSFNWAEYRRQHGFMEVPA